MADPILYTACGCPACEGWAKVREAWAAAVQAAEWPEPAEPVVCCRVTGQRIPARGPTLLAELTEDE